MLLFLLSLVDSDAKPVLLLNYASGETENKVGDVYRLQNGDTTPLSQKALAFAVHGTASSIGSGASCTLKIETSADGTNWMPVSQAVLNADHTTLNVVLENSSVVVASKIRVSAVVSGDITWTAKVVGIATGSIKAFKV